MDDVRALLLELISQCVPVGAVLVYVFVAVRRTKVDCMRTCERVHEEMRRLTREPDGEALMLPPPESEPEPEPPAPLPIARLHRR